jgi:riboflavin synthase
MGESIACNGVCLTLTSYSETQMSFDVGPKTLEVTNFNALQKNDLINIERSLSYGSKVSGHLISGHVDILGKVTQINVLTEYWILTINFSKDYEKLIIHKGSIAIKGVSLTIAQISVADSVSIEIMVIPHTLEHTNLKLLKVDDKVEIEFDHQIKILDKLVRSYLKK